MYYGLSPKETRKLAYEFAVKNKKTFPDSWNKNAMAGEDWLSGYMKRNTGITIRKPEATSLAIKSYKL